MRSGADLSRPCLSGSPAERRHPGPPSGSLLTSRSTVSLGQLQTYKPTTESGH